MEPQFDELAQLVAQWRDPSIHSVVIQSRTGENSGFTQYSVEELYGMASNPGLSRERRGCESRAGEQDSAGQHRPAGPAGKPDPGVTAPDEILGTDRFKSGSGRRTEQLSG